MISPNLDFLNKNLYRKYPIWSDSTLQTTEGVQLPLGLFASCRLSSVTGYDKLYISRIRIDDAFLSVTISVHLDAGDLQVGVFNGAVLSDFQTLTLYSFYPFISGTLTTGLIASLAAFNGTHGLDYATGRIEDSLVFCYPRPGVTGLVHDGVTATGDIVFDLTNLGYALSASSSSSSGDGLTSLAFEVIDYTSVASKADRASRLGTCTQPQISSINSVLPDADGNIDLVFVYPLTFTLGTQDITVATTMSLEELCPVNDRLPPVSEVDDYPTFMTTSAPEWQAWPNYQI